MRKFIFTIIIGGSLCACSSEKNESDNLQAEYVINFNPNEVKEKVVFSELFDHLEYIPLETSDEIIIKDITKLKRVKNSIYILDKSTQTVFSFDLNGKIQWKIRKVGQGPQEYSQLMDFDIDEKNNKLYLFSRREKIQVYDLSGRFIEEYAIPLNAWSFAFNNDIMCAYFGNAYDDEGNNHLLIFNKDETIMKKEVSFQNDKSGKIKIYNSPNAFYHHDNDLRFYMPFLPNIYAIKKDSVYIKYHFDFGEYTIPENYFTDHSIEDLEETKYAYGLNSYWENDKYLSFKITLNQKSLTLLYSKNKEQIISDEIHDDLGRCFPTISEVTDEIALGFRSTEDLIAEYNFAKEESKGTILENIINKITEDDNPVIFFYYFK